MWHPRRLGASQLSLTLVLTSLTLGIALSPPASAAKPAVKAPAVVVTERAGKAVVVLKLAKRAPKRLKVVWATKPGSAQAGKDFKAARGTVVVAKGKRSARLSVRIVNDTIAEPTESFTVALRSATAKVPARVRVTIRDDDGGGPGGPGTLTYPKTISGPVSGHTKVAVYSGGTVSDDLHVEWSGTITLAYQHNDPVLGTPWGRSELHYVVQSASITWTASGTCTGSGTLSGSQLTGELLLDEAKAGPGFDEDARYWDYSIYLAPVSGTSGNLPVTCSGSPGNAGGRVGQGGFGGALVYNGYASADQPASNRYSTTRFSFAGTADPAALTYDNTWQLTGSGVAVR